MNSIAYDKHLLSAVPGLSKQCRRLIQHLSINSTDLTGSIASTLSIGNVSDCAARCNDTLEPLGWRIVARLPKPLSKNKFGEHSLQCEWALQRV